jgi:hypothetical protein
VKAIFNILIVWTMLLTLPLQGVAAATMSCCPPPSAAAQDCHDHDAMIDDGHTAAAHHHAAKCATCGTCGICIPMAPSFVGAPAVSASQSIATPVDQHTPTSVDLAHPERPPRA